MRSYRYPAVFARAEEGGMTVTFRDVPEAITQGETVEDAIEQAVDALDEAITGRINSGQQIPLATKQRKGEYLIPVPPQTAAKAALYEEIKAHQMSKVELAALLGIDEKEVRRLLDPHHPSKMTRIADVLKRVGKDIVLSVEDRSEMAAKV